MPHLRVGDAEPRERPLGKISDRDHDLDRKQCHEGGQEWRAEEQLAGSRDAIRKWIRGDEWMEWKCVPEQRQRLDILDRRPHHRSAGFRRSLRSGCRFSVAAILAEEAAVDAAEHDLFARERDACQAAAAMAG